jgi:hypothetical protein
VIRNGHKGVERVKKEQNLEVEKILESAERNFQQLFQHYDKITKAFTSPNLSCQRRAVQMQ